MTFGPLDIHDRLRSVEAENADLRAQLAAKNVEFSKATHDFAIVTTEIFDRAERAEVERDALREDAKRLDWMERQNVQVKGLRRYGSGPVLFRVEPDLEDERSDLRSKIDAIAQEQKP